MREISFRLWDKAHQCWFDENEFDINISLDGSVWACHSDQEWFEVTDSVSLMRFTGVFDKNSVPIFEGDIVEYYTSAQNKSPHWTKVVEWRANRNAVGFNFGKGKPSGSAHVVVGNRFEHPELLEQS